MVVAMIKPKSAFWVRPVLERGTYNIGRQGFLYEVWVHPHSLYIIDRIPLA